MIKPLLLALTPLILVAADDIRFAPEAGQSVTRTVSLVMTSDIDESNTLINGSSDMSPKVEASTKYTRDLVVVDEYSALDAGRPSKLRRSFDQVAAVVESPVKIEAMGVSMDADLRYVGSSPVAGKTVDFTWDADAGAYAKAFVDDEDAAAELLDPLVEDMDLRALLPAEAVAEGDSWEVDAAAFVSILFSAGDLQMEWVSEGDEPPAGIPDMADQPSAQEQWSALGECEVSAKYAGTREVEGSTYAVIEVEASLEALLDSTERALDALEDATPDGTQIDVSVAESESFLEGTGTLLWDLAAKRAAKFEFSGDISGSERQEMAIDIGGQSMEIESDTSTSGKLELVITIE